MDVVVVGAGPTGLVAACDLLAAGVSVRVVDRAAGPAVTSRALGLQPRGVEVVDRLGALGKLPERFIGIRRVVVHVNGEPVVTLGMNTRTTLVTKPNMLMSQAAVEGALRERFAELGGVVEWGVEFAGADQDELGVTVRLGDGGSIRAGWVVGCDGAHSAVRKNSGIGFPGVPLGERFLLADVRAELPLARDGVSVWLRGEELFAAFPLPGDDLWRLMTSASADVADNGVLPAMSRALAERAGLPDVAIGRVEWTSVFRFHRRLADTYRTGRVLLAGDAAHIHSPFGGQGMNTGMGDAENLAWKLALVVAGRAAESLLDTYQAERRPIAEEVLKSTTGVTRIALVDHPVARLLRDRVLMPLLNRPFAQRYITEQSSQLKVHYRGGPLAPSSFLPSSLLPSSLLRGPRPGDRIPDVPCVRGDGTPTRLHAELGARWVLLGAEETDECAVLARKRLGEDLVTVLRADRADLLLVRPDAHLAWRGPVQPDGLDRWLTGMLGG